MSDFERELEQELHRVLDGTAGMPIPPWRAVRARGGLAALMGTAGAAVALKVLGGVAVAAAAVILAGAVTTGSLNPEDWGQQVKNEVISCKSDLAQGEHGIGECVSDFANQHGQLVASSARHHGKENGNGQGQNGNGQGNGNGQHRTLPDGRE
jgi:hypothetical protein